MKSKTKRTLKTIALGLLGLLVVGGAVAGISSLVAKDDDGYEKTTLNYTIGDLDISTGKVEKSKKAMYTKEALNVEALKFELDFENNIEYQLYFYDENQEFVSVSQVYTKNSTHEDLESSYVRVVIRVTEKDTELSIFNQLKYSNQLSVRVVKKAPAKLLTITIENGEDDVTIQYLEGMTWNEWLESEYYVNGFIKASTTPDPNELTFPINYNGNELIYVCEDAPDNTAVPVFSEDIIGGVSNYRVNN